LDLNGDGNNGDLLAGTKVNQFNRGLGKQDLAKLVDIFDKTYSGKKDANGVPIPLITVTLYSNPGPKLMQGNRIVSSLYFYPGQTSAETSSGFYVQQSGISV
jgi:hypothetical protein